MLLRKIKNNGSTDKKATNQENPWQAKVYKNPIGKTITNWFLPKKGTKEYRKIQKLLKDSASKMKMEWLYVNRIVIGLLSGIVTTALLIMLHVTSINWVYTEPTTDYDILGSLSAKEEKAAMELTYSDNEILDRFKNKPNTTKEDIMEASRFIFSYN